MSYVHVRPDGKAGLAEGIIDDTYLSVSFKNLTFTEILASKH